MASGITIGQNLNTVGAPGQSFYNGSQIPPRAGNTGELIVGQGHGKDYESAYRKAMFYSYATAKTLTAANTTYTGHGVYNNNTAVNLIVRKVAVGVSVTSASMTGIALGVSTGSATSLTAATQVGSTFIGASNPTCTSFSAATLANAGTPVFLLAHNTVAINTVGVDAIMWDLDGSIIVPAGYTVHLLALGAASAASAVTSSIFWEEVPA